MRHQHYCPSFDSTLTKLISIPLVLLNSNNEIKRHFQSQTRVIILLKTGAKVRKEAHFCSENLKWKSGSV
jgi:hypothetical protein